MSDDDVKDGGSGGSGKMLLILVLLAGLGIGGAAVYFLLPQGEVTEASEEVVEKKEPKNLVSVSFEQVAVPIYREHRGQTRFIGNFFIDFDINVDGDDNAVLIRRARNRLQHAFLTKIGTGSLMKEESQTELDVERAGEVLKAAAEEVVGPDLVHSVAVTQAIRASN